VKDKLIKAISSCLYIGYVPLLGATLASILSVVLYAVIYIFFGMSAYIAIFSGLLILGLFVSAEAENLYHVHDSSRIVIDEFTACLVVFFKIPAKLSLLVLGLVIFRLLDIIKPYPANKVERSRTKFSIMADDLIVAVYGNLIMQVILFFFY
jgi:phosphatidylglycerophosphatase A